jgi:sugar (pentulose or hexulose) kinase
MGHTRHTAVIDIGKTNAKLSVVDLDTLTEISVRKRRNEVLPGPPYPHYDTDGLWRFILDGLSELQSELGIDAITVTTHGASAALVGEDGQLAAPVLDYEHDGPDAFADAYNAVRPDFAETGSPRLPQGLNVGAQIYWQFRQFPEIRAATRLILTYPQYWSWRLTGRATVEATSLGCHTDLWRPAGGAFSSLVASQGWSDLMAPLARADEMLGSILPGLADVTGVSPDTPVYCGLHDSNASLYPHLLSRSAPFAVVSTGTWVITMAIGGNPVTLDPGRDTLINVDALGSSVPSARFMGGREFERMIGTETTDYNQADIDAVIGGGVMLLPSVETRSGPFPGRHHEWTADEAALPSGQRYVAVSFYLALMTATCLEITGAAGPTLVEGPFAQNETFRVMLAAASGRPVDAVAGTGTSIGAALLTADRQAQKPAAPIVMANITDAMTDYARRWKSKQLGGG